MSGESLIYDKIVQGVELTHGEIVALLSVDTDSEMFYRLLRAANLQSRRLYGDRGYIFAQIGLNAEPCSINCGFCSMGGEHYSVGESYKNGFEQIAPTVREIAADGRVSDLFLMTTADYPQQEFIEAGRRVRAMIGDKMRLVANIGDFERGVARGLKEAGFTGVYHIVRLGEGVDTQASPEQRMKTIDAVLAEGLELYYCIEPIGPEHTPKQIADEILRARSFGVTAMAAMRRKAVEGTPCQDRGEITLAELCKIAAVTALVVKPSRSMNVHETTELSLIAGVNQLYAEIGANPRDNAASTELSRGLSITKSVELLNNYEIKLI